MCIFLRVVLFRRTKALGKPAKFIRVAKHQKCNSRIRPAPLIATAGPQQAGENQNRATKHGEDRDSRFATRSAVSPNGGQADQQLSG